MEDCGRYLDLDSCRMPERLAEYSMLLKYNTLKYNMVDCSMI